MEFCKIKFFKRIILALALVLLLNSALHVNIAAAKSISEKENSNRVMTILGKEMHICASGGSKIISINEYIKLFNAKYFADSNNQITLKKISDPINFESETEFVFYIKTVDIFGFIASHQFKSFDYYSLASRAPPVAA